MAADSAHAGVLAEGPATRIPAADSARAAGAAVAWLCRRSGAPEFRLDPERRDAALLRIEEFDSAAVAAIASFPRGASIATGATLSSPLRPATDTLHIGRTP